MKCHSWNFCWHLDRRAAFQAIRDLRPLRQVLTFVCSGFWRALRFHRKFCSWFLALFCRWTPRRLRGKHWTARRYNSLTLSEKNKIKRFLQKARSKDFFGHSLKDFYIHLLLKPVSDYQSSINVHQVKQFVQQPAVAAPTLLPSVAESDVFIFFISFNL